MLVTQILASKPNQKILTIAPSATVADAVKMLTKHRIGALVASSDGRVTSGIVSERDVVRELGKHGPSCLGFEVSRIMSRSVVTCTENETADEVLAKMTEGRFRHMPVVDENGMTGLISIGDVVKARLAELNMEKEALEGMIMGH